MSTNSRYLFKAVFISEVEVFCCFLKNTWKITICESTAQQNMRILSLPKILTSQSGVLVNFRNQHSNAHL
jgi:hypothetical protein